MLYFKEDKFVDIIRTRYNEKGLIPEDLKSASEKIDGIDFKDLKDILNNTSKNDLSVKVVIAFANLFNCSINELLGFEDTVTSKEVLNVNKIIQTEPDDIAEIVVDLKIMKKNSEKFETIKKLIKILNK